MSVSSALNASVSGLRVNSTRLATISDNIANSATYGYKRSEVDFASQVIDQQLIEIPVPGDLEEVALDPLWAAGGEPHRERRDAVDEGSGEDLQEQGCSGRNRRQHRARQ